MREFTKSMMSYTWAMSLFGLQQTLNLLTPQGQRQGHPATSAFNTVAGAAREELGNSLAAAYRAGDNIQRGVVDATFSLCTLGIFNRGNRSDGARVGGAEQVASDVARGTAETFQQTVRAARQATDVIGQALGNPTGQRQAERTPQDNASDWRSGPTVNDAAS
jgi:hypothetical protein